jgi:hypothetical protein
MKRMSISFLVILALLAIAGCTGKGSGKKEAPAVTDTITVHDTGFTGIKQFMSGHYKVSEVTFKNGVRDGLMKTFYIGGQIRTTFWYVNGLKEDSARWYYQTGELFRTTPFRHDTVDGIQKQFYRTGVIRAKIGYNRGMRTPYIQEYASNGKIIGGYPDIVVKTTDEYRTKGTLRIELSLSDNSNKVKFYKGEFTEGRFDTTLVKPIVTVKGRAGLVLRKSSTPGPGFLSVIAEIGTPLGNKYLTSKKIELPYNDLK